MSRLKAEVIKYSKKLNITNLSALRSGNISVRAKERGIDGFYITPSGRKYGSLKTKDIIFVSLKNLETYNKKNNSSYFIPLRRDIVDRNGTLISRNVKSFHAAIKPDLVKDKKEEFNLATQNPEKIKELEKILDDYLKRVSAPKWQDGITWKNTPIKEINSNY